MSLDSKFSHLSDILHVEVAALAPPAEAHARIAYALAELRKYLTPDSHDDIAAQQQREMESYYEASGEMLPMEPREEVPVESVA